jgi:hypothetical protein
MSTQFKIPVNGVIIKKTDSGSYSFKRNDKPWERSSLTKIRNLIGKQKFNFVENSSSLFPDKNSLFTDESSALKFQFRIL